jgi:hypothetical protein
MNSLILALIGAQVTYAVSLGTQIGADPDVVVATNNGVDGAARSEEVR